MAYDSTHRRDFGHYLFKFKMSMINSTFEDARFLKEIITNNAWGSFVFEGKSGPIIGIHGVLAGWPKNGVRQFMAKYSVKGQLLFLGHLLKGLEEYDKYIDEAIKKYPNSLIVGCSAGGILALEYVNRKKLWNKINKIVTIASPLNGMAIKYRFLGKTTKQLTRNSNYLKMILNIKPPKGKVVSIFAQYDKFVGNPNLMKLNWPKIITTAKSHGDLQNHYDWFDDILKKELNIL